MHDAPLHDPFDALADPSTARPLVVPIAGPALEAVCPPPDVASTGTIEALPTPRQEGPWDRLCDQLATEHANGEGVLAAALRRALLTGSARLPLADGAPALDLVRLPRGSALFDVRRRGEPAWVLEAPEVLFTGSAADWEALPSLQPEPRAGALCLVARFALVRLDGATEISPHPSAAIPLADWMWCGHRVWGYSLLIVWFDATPEALATWFEGRLHARAATPTEACPAPRPDWEIGLDGDALFVRRSYDEPTDASQLQWERWALARALEAPFELLSWRVTETEMGGLDAWGRDRETLRAHLSPDADRRQALRASYRAPSTEVVPCAAPGVPELADALGPVLAALGSEPIAAPTIQHLSALARTGARARIPRRVVLSLRPGAKGDEGAFALLAALEAAVAGTVTFSISWQR